MVINRVLWAEKLHQISVGGMAMTWLEEQGDGITNMKWEADKTQGLLRDCVPAKVFELDSGREPLKYLTRAKMYLCVLCRLLSGCRTWLD